MSPTARPRILADILLGASLLMVENVGLAVQQSEQQLPDRELPGPLVVPDQPLSSPGRGEKLTLEQRADIFMARKSYADAVDYFQRALNEKRRRDPGLWNKLGIAYQQMQNTSAARRAYKESIRLDKNFAEAWNNLGTTYYLENRWKKSLKYYREALKLNPNSASFHINLGTSYYNLKKVPEAIEEYRTALTLNPAILTEHSTLGTTISARAADAKFYFYMAKVFAALGRADEAVRYLRRAFEDGFNDFKLLDGDADFKKLSELPAYVELRANPPKPIRE